MVEAKDNRHSLGAGMQQALNYSEMHGDLPFVFSSNGDGFLFHDRTVTSGNVEREIALEAFPSPFNHLGTPVEIVRMFGGKTGYKSAVNELTQHIYE